MNRRNALRSIGLVTGGLITIPSWMISCGISDQETHQSGFSLEHQHLLTQITDTFIPAANGVGAVDMGVDKFLQVLIDDCYEPKDQQQFKDQLDALAKSAHHEYDQAFGECTSDEREKLLLRMSTSDNKDQQEFYKLIKSEIIRGYTTSQKVMVDYLGYKVAPGHFYGSVKINA
jgi:hypothetical protein